MSLSLTESASAILNDAKAPAHLRFTAGITLSDYHDGRKPIGDPVWASCGEKPLKPRERGGAASQAEQHGYVTLDAVNENGTVATLTRAGAKALKDYANDRAGAATSPTPTEKPVTAPTAKEEPTITIKMVLRDGKVEYEIATNCEVPASFALTSSRDPNRMKGVMTNCVRQLFGVQAPTHGDE